MDGRLFVRVNPGGLPGYRTRSDVQRYTDHGSATSQFGIPSEELVERLAGYPLPVSGLHVHVGTDQLVKHTVARWEHPIAGPDHRILPRSGPDGLAGPLCFAGDVLYPETDLTGIETGDPLLFGQAGSYCEAVSSRFNGRRAPVHVVRPAEPASVREDG